MTNRQVILGFGSLALALLLLAGVQSGGARTQAQTTENTEADARVMVTVHYLEVVTPDVDAVCRTYEQLHGVTFAKPDASLGNARTAKLPSGGLLGVRAPLRPTEKPIVRPYILVEDIEASVGKAAAAGAKIALPPMKLPGHGKCAIFIQGGVEHGLWQPPAPVQ